MEIFNESRLIAENKLFPPAIIIDHNDIAIKIPGLFNGDEKMIPYSQIKSVDIICPVIGLSSIIIETTCEGMIKAHGFSKYNVKRMRDLILAKANAA
jgi:uncharacterized membrane protein YdbT with pleckstrin-like domain